jgi:hypothetical protein
MCLAVLWNRFVVDSAGFAFPSSATVLSGAPVAIFDALFSCLSIKDWQPVHIKLAPTGIDPPRFA